MRKLMTLLVLCALGFQAFAQEVSSRQEISIFSVNYFGAPPAPVQTDLEFAARIGKTQVEVSVRGSGDPRVDQIFRNTIRTVDAEIRQVFSALNRFDILGLPQKVDSANLQDFIAAIQEYKASTTEIPEAVRLGQEAFTEADLNSLINSFMLVVPEISYYELSMQDEGKWQASMVTSVSIINMENGRTISSFNLETSGYDEDPQEAMSDAVSGIAGQLDFRIRSIPEFQIRTAVLERNGGRLVLQLGRDMGIRTGEEFEVVRFEDLAGIAYPRRIALLRVQEVQENFSFARIVYEDRRVVAGDQVREVPRAGADIVPYLSAVWALGSPSIESLSLGAKFTPNRGFYAFRPLVGIEVLFSTASTSGAVEGIPVSILLGAEYNIFLRRIRLSPQAMVGLIGQLPLAEDQDFSLRGMKSSFLAGLSYLIPGGNDALELYAESGYEIQFPLGGGSIVQGLVFGAGVRFR